MLGKSTTKPIPSTVKLVSAMFVLKMIELWAVFSLLGASVPLGAMILIACIKLILLTLNVFFFVILILVILSWVNPGGYNPVIGVLHALAEPLLRPVRRVIPPVGGFDLSSLVVLIALQVVSLLIGDVMRAVGGNVGHFASTLL